MRKIYLLAITFFLFLILSSCTKEDTTFTTTCNFTVDSAAFTLDEEEYIETYVYNKESVLEVYVNGESVDSGLTVTVGDSIYYLYGAWDTLRVLGAECSDLSTN